MKTFFLSLILMCNITFSQDKNLVDEFCRSIVNNVENEKIYNVFIKQNTLQQQERFKLFSLQLDEIKKKITSQCYTVYNYHEAFNKKKINYGFINTNKDDIYILYFNEDLIIPILLDKQSKIIAISTMDKGQIRVFILI